jgi:hypothetical protein
MTGKFQTVGAEVMRVLTWEMANTGYKEIIKTVRQGMKCIQALLGGFEKNMSQTVSDKADQ